MTIKGYQFDRETPTPLSDSRLYHTLAFNWNGVIPGIDDAMGVVVSGQIATIAKGACMIKGRYIEIAEAHDVVISQEAANGSYLVITVDLSEQNQSTGVIGSGEYIPINNQVRAEVVPAVVQEDINNDGSIYMMPLGQLSNATGTWTFVRADESYKGNLPFPISSGGTGITENPSMMVNLASTDADNVFTPTPRPGVTGILPVSRGGIGIDSNPSMLTNLATTKVANVLQPSPRPGVTGVLPIANGGTGVANVQAAIKAFSPTTAKSIAVGYSFYPVFIRTGNIVSVSSLVNGSGYPAATSFTGLTEKIPVGFRPVSTIDMAGNAGNTSVTIRMLPSGALYFFNWGAATSKDITFVGMWPTSDAWPA